MKKNIFKTAIFVFTILCSTVLFAQLSKSNVLDGVYEKHIYKEKDIIPYDHIRESDVFWSRRIWRVIDTREKMNLVFIYPKPNPPQMLIDIILDAAIAGEMTVYDPVDDEFTKPITPEEVKSIGAGDDTIQSTDPVTLEEVTKVVHNELTRTNIHKFRIKEDWFFDKETSTMQVRILGISPVMDVVDADGNMRGTQPLFWAYYPDLRPILVRWEAFNPLNDAVRMTWEDIFEMRFFSSYIMKESNVYDRRIEGYVTGIDALLEAERVKNDLFLFEHDVWNF